MPMASSPGSDLFHEYLLSHAAMGPDDPAIIDGARLWSYGELRGRAQEQAEILDSAGLRHGDVMVVELAPSPGAVALMIAAASLGVVFVHVSPDTPAARKDFMLGHLEAKARVGRTASPLLANHSAIVPGVLDEDERLQMLGSTPPHGERRAPSAHDLVYIVFTSGSSGIPKGIMMSHRAVVTFWRGIAGFGVDPGVRLGSASPFQFDLSLLSLGMALGAGGCLVQIPAILLHQPSGFVRYLAEHQVTQVNGVPSLWRAMLAGNSAPLLQETALDTILFAGEVFPFEGLRALRAAVPELRIVNVFGHSESIACTYKVLPSPLTSIDGRLPFGTEAIDGMTMTVVGEDEALIDGPGTIGELYIEGDSLFDGYFKDQAATEAALVRSPRPGSDRTAFRSGDLVFLDDAGEHYFHSRRDFQVKVLGHRIELDEIDVHLERHDEVFQAVSVLVADDPPRIVSFIQTKPGPAETNGQEAEELARQLREHCVRSLPRIMVPRRFEFIDSLPTTINGKIDRRALLGQVTSP